ncbi:hypothetical protein FHS83_000058 [Rhizomicrobium palustre]|uniref:DUF2934 domain-containing protein n=1 Tax=Rhizomicrobium palustre TaxID=189966 RepID=A0A846MUI6_9PROT|nr:DUF2934 domain-containing protein [Rhizomicrobium palustre]NIK86740.1 hypothetical protein [Rhizomicrobium palustre]
MQKEELIRARAYRLWETDGRPLGRDGEHWQRAAAEIEAELAAHQSGENDVPAANITIHHGPDSASPTPGFERADGLSTPGISAKPAKG